MQQQTAEISSLQMSGSTRPENDMSLLRTENCSTTERESEIERGRERGRERGGERALI